MTVQFTVLRKWPIVFPFGILYFDIESNVTLSMLHARD